MSESTLRLILVAATVLVVAVAVLVLRQRDRAPSRRVGRVGLGIGVYLFTSRSCLDCQAARDLLEARLGPDGFVEIAWEEEPHIFEAISIDLVPSTLVVDGDGRGRLWTGQPDRMIYAVDP